MVQEVRAMDDELVLPTRTRVAPLRPARRAASPAARPVSARPIGASMAEAEALGLDLIAPDVLAAVGSILAAAERPAVERSAVARSAVERSAVERSAALSLDELRARRVSALSFELRSTLALISGYSQALLHLPLDDESRRQYLEQIPVAAANLADVANELLSIAAEAEAPERRVAESPPPRLTLRPVPAR